MIKIFKKICCTVMLLHGSIFLSAQTIKQFVKENTVAIATIQPDADNFADLEPFGNAVADARVVMLGEQDHGDAPTFLAKTRLIKYLHEKKGFNVLAFESDFFALNDGWEKLDKQKGFIDSFLKNNIFPIWTVCNACSNLLYDYIPATFTSVNPLQITGIDNQLILTHSHNSLAASLDSILKLYDFPITKQSSYATTILPAIQSLGRYYLLSAKDKKIFKELEDYLKQIKAEAGSRLASDDFWMLIIDNLIAENKEYENKNDYIIAGNTRDMQMANNLRWLCDIKFSNKKIIVWAANGHIAKFGNANEASDKKIVRMGSYFTNDTARLRTTYSLGFDSYSGYAGRLGWDTSKIAEPKSDGFENWIDRQYEYAFIDFKKFKSSENYKPSSFFLKGMGHMNYKENWTEIFDGIFFIRSMYACKMLK